MKRPSLPLLPVFLVLALSGQQARAQTCGSSGNDGTPSAGNNRSGCGQTKTTAVFTEEKGAQKIRPSESGSETLGQVSSSEQSSPADTPDPRYRLTVWSGSLMAVNAGLKVATHGFYSIVSVGGVNLYGDVCKATAYSLQLGFQFPVDSVYAAVDAGYSFLDNDEPAASSKNAPDQNIISIRGSLGIKVSRKITFFLGTGMIYAQNYGKKYYKGEMAPLFFAGFELF